MQIDESADAQYRGQIDVAEVAIADLVRDAVRSCYGVVGIGTSSGSGLVTKVTLPWRRSSIGFSMRDGWNSDSVPVFVAFGTPIATVARNVIQTVSFQLTQTLGLAVERVDVRVAGLRHADNSESSTE